MSAAFMLRSTSPHSDDQNLSDHLFLPSMLIGGYLWRRRSRIFFLRLGLPDPSSNSHLIFHRCWGIQGIVARTLSLLFLVRG